MKNNTMTTQDLKNEFDDFKKSLWNIAKIIITIFGIILVSVQGCTIYFVKSNDKRIDRNLEQIEILAERSSAQDDKLLERLVQNEISLKSVEQDIKYIRDTTNRIEASTGESLIRLDSKMDKIGQKLIQLEMSKK